MTRLCELTAAEVSCCVGGQEYRLTPLRMADLGQIERACPDGATCNLLPAESSLQNLARLLETTTGQELAFWHCLRRHQPNLSRDAASEMLRQTREQSDDFEQLWLALTGFPTDHARLGTTHSVFLALSRSYGWTPQQIGELTVTQMLAYVDGFNERRTIWMTAGEARARRVQWSPSNMVRQRPSPALSVATVDTGAEVTAEQSDVLEYAGQPRRQARESLESMSRSVAEVQLSLSRLERRDHAARYGWPEHAG